MLATASGCVPSGRRRDAGRQGRAWVSPVGNFYGSTLVRLRAGDPAAPTLGFVAAVALAEVVAQLLPSRTQEWSGVGARPAPDRSIDSVGTPPSPLPQAGGGAVLKWPNDLLIDGAKLSGILLERADDTVVVGVGVNLAHGPDLPDRRTTSLAAQGLTIAPETFAPLLAEVFARWLQRWREVGFGAVRAQWLAVANPAGTPLRAALPDGETVAGAFDDLDATGALILRLASGERRAIHAGDVFLV